MALMEIICASCGAPFMKATGEINRSIRRGAPIYCNRLCAGIARRKNKSKAQKVEEKRLYDIEYRAKNQEKLKEAKSAYHQRTYDPEKARIERQKKMPRHIEYCRRPEYREYKRAYDRKRRAQLQYGPFDECFLLLQDIDFEVGSRMTDYEVRIANNTYGKAQKRRREYEQLIGRKS